MGPSISDYYRQQIIPQMRGDVLQISEEKVLQTDSSALHQEYFQKYALSPIQEDTNSGASYDLQDYVKTIRSHEREDFYRGEGDLVNFSCQRVVVEIPIIPNQDISTISQLRGNTYSLSYSDRDFDWDRSRITQTIETRGYGFKYDEDKIAREVEGSLSRIREMIGYRNQTIQQENISFSQAISQAIDERKKYIADSALNLSALEKKISIPLRKKTEEIKKQDEVVSLTPSPSLKSARSRKQPSKPKKKYDVFISHASEDKPYVSVLSARLQEEGLSVWYDSYEISWGDDLRTTIDNGLKNSKFGIVIFSRSFLSKKKWTDYELNGLFAREQDGVKVILPIWHEISRKEVEEYSPTFADRLAKNSDNTEDIVAELKRLATSTGIR